jgi:hypothetical protein
VQVARLCPGPDLLPRALEHLSRRGDGERVVVPPARARPPTEGLSASRNRCNPGSAATLQTMRRVGLITAAVARCARRRGGRAPWPRATPCYWDSRSRRRAPRGAAATPIESSSDGKPTTSSRRGAAVDDGRDAAALVEAGARLVPAGVGSSSTRARRVLGRPGARPRPEREDLASGSRARCRSRAAPRSSPQGSFSILPSQPGDAVDADVWSPHSRRRHDRRADALPALTTSSRR